MELHILLHLENRNLQKKKKRKSSRIEFVLNFVAIFLSMSGIKESVRNPSSILLRSLILTLFMAENAIYVVAVAMGKRGLCCCPCCVKNSFTLLWRLLLMPNFLMIDLDCCSR
jgi:hypothetical protein